ncbi:MAG TPA: YlcI/YnfO family protein [Thermoguttaceae bacterium]|nr:YlcI/YnfO family protein [Thermoguttaceae bacterium]
MSAISVRLPESLHQQVRDLAKQENVSINQFIAAAVAEKMSALMTAEYLEERAKRGDRDRFERVLAKIPDTPPEDHDRL